MAMIWKKTLRKTLSFYAILITSILLLFLIFHVNHEASAKNASAEEKDETLQNDDKQWLGAWTANPHPPYDDGVSNEGFQDQTIRMIVQPHMDGDSLRLRLSNTFGSEALTFKEVHIADSESDAKVIEASNQQVTFNEESSVTIPAGESVESDAITYDVKNGENLAVSLYVPDNSGPTTWHSWSQQTSYIAPGNQTAETNGDSFDEEIDAWFWLEAIDVQADASAQGAIVTFGDSITDVGHSTLNANNRWPDFLARRFNKLPKSQQLSVMNGGISGNKILGDSPTGGISALERMEKDVLSQTGVTDIILLEGINDILNQSPASAEEIIDGMQQIIDRAHQHDLNIYGGTLTPFEGYGGYTTELETIREEVNDWIRTSDAFDGVIDFDQAIHDPENPHRMLPVYDAGDHLHPGDAGLEAMANVIDLTMFGIIDNIDDMKKMVEQFEEQGEFNDSDLGHDFMIHLTAIDHFVKEQDHEKTLKHLQGFKDLLDYHQKEDSISIDAYEFLQSGTDYLMGKHE